MTATAGDGVDDKIIDIIRKYGIAGLLGAAAGMMAMDGEVQAGTRR